MEQLSKNDPAEAFLAEALTGVEFRDIIGWDEDAENHYYGQEAVRKLIEGKLDYMQAHDSATDTPMVYENTSQVDPEARGIYKAEFLGSEAL